jgi:ribonuclease HI
MKFLAWNCQGIGNPRTARACHKLIATHKPDLLFLSETKILSSNTVFLSRLRDTYKAHQVDCSTSGGGRAGGLIIIWNPCNIDLTIINENLNYIDMQITTNNLCWRATGIYGYPQNQNKHLTCKLINELYGASQHSNWLIFGDFNLSLYNEEKLGGQPIDHHLLSLFRSTIDSCQLQDLGYEGEIYTWNNRQEDQQHIRARLDRFLASEGWIKSFPHYKNSHLTRYRSDHCPILLDFSSNPTCRSKKNQKKGNKYEVMWTKHADHIKIMKNAWQQANGSLTRKLSSVLHNMQSWGNDQFGCIAKKIKIAQSELQALNTQSDLSNIMQQIHSKELELDSLLENEEVWWSQRARVLWLQHGDRNTKFFHQKASQRKQRNNIESIQDIHGTTHYDHDNIEQTLTNHFKTLFTSQATHNIEMTVAVVNNRITPEMYEFLNSPYTAYDVFEAIKYMKGMAAPGPDGLPAIFYQNYWDTLGNDVTQAVLDVLNNDSDPRPFNNTHICLIPKKKNPITPGDYRPIALCNVIYKIITKTISNRLKVILPKVISQNQSAFLPDRLITDNTLVAYEVFHYFKHTSSKKGYVGIKTDMAKAYDRVEWPFLSTTLNAFGFPQKLINTIIKCVSIVQLSILINGNPSLPFSPQRGLRQGDPLSPYLFIICADVLSGLLSQAHLGKHIHGVKIAPSAPEITHLLFADDSLFFCRADKEEARYIKHIIQTYQEASGQMVNLDKSELMFSKCVPVNNQREISQVLPMQRVDHFSSYLGMPMEMGRSKAQLFSHLSDKVWKKLKGWKEKKLSFAGRGTLIKAVAQAIPTYIMSCFLLPKKLCKHLEQMACNFWWGSSSDKRKLHWVNWKKMCKNKKSGGLGFRSTHDFNEALLAKQGWRIATQPESLLAKLLKAKYFPKCHFMEAKPSHMISFTWRSIIQARWILKKGCYWTIGNGENVNIWEDNWLPQQNGFKTWTKPPDDTSIAKVKDLINLNTGSWKTNTIDQLFLPFEARQIQSIPLVDLQASDELTWAYTKDGSYSVKSGYQAISDWKNQEQTYAGSNYNDMDSVWKHLWKLKIPPKHAHLTWRILNNALSVKANLNSRGINCDPTCPRCHKDIETTDHLFLDCEWAQAIWFSSPLTINFNILAQKLSFTDWLCGILKSNKSEEMGNIITIIYTIWYARNLLVFQNKDSPAMHVVHQAMSSSREFQASVATLNNTTKSPTTGAHGHNIYWTPPPRATLKLNVDAHPCGDGRWALGLVLRSERGKCVGAMTKVVRGSENIVDGEAYGLNTALDLLENFADTRIIVEMDSRTIVTAVQKRQYPRCYWGRIAKRCGDLFDQNPRFKINWVRRSGNTVAHALANWARLEPNKYWNDQFPLCINDMIQKDISSCNFDSD